MAKKKKIRRTFVAGPLENERLFVNEDQDVYPYFDPESQKVHIYTLRKFGTDDDAPYAFLHNGVAYMAPDKIPVGPPKRRHRIVRRPQQSDKGHPVTMHAQEVAKRYMGVVKKLRRMLRKSRVKVKANEMHRGQLDKRIDSLQEDLEYISDEAESKLHRARMALVDMEYFLEDLFPGEYQSVSLSHDEFADFLDQDKDYEAWKQSYYFDKDTRSLAMKREQDKQRVRDYEDRVFKKKVRDSNKRAGKDSWDDDEGEYLEWDDAPLTEEERAAKEAYDDGIPF